MTFNIENLIDKHSTEKYRDFQSKLLPGINNIAGIRLPILRKTAKQLAQDPKQYIYSDQPDRYFEQTMLRGMIIGYADCDTEKRLEYIKKFVPMIDNWSVCDSFCVGLKFTKTDKQKVYDFLQSYIYSDKEFFMRFGIVMLLFYYIDDQYIDRVLEILSKLDPNQYYAQMAVAWCFSIAYKHYPNKTLSVLDSCNISEFIYKKSKQKIRELR